MHVSSEGNITRRQAVKVAGPTGAAYVLAPALGMLDTGPARALTAGASAARLTPELTEGP